MNIVFIFNASTEWVHGAQDPADAGREVVLRLVPSQLGLRRCRRLR
jgi:hypothetical protein